MKKTLHENIKTIGTIITIFLTLGGVVVSLFNYTLLNQLQPVHASISEIKFVQAAEEKEREKLATKEQVEAMNEKVTIMQGQLQFLYEQGLK